MSLGIIDTDISMEVVREQEGVLREPVRSRAHEVANSWFEEEAGRIRTESLDRLLTLLNTLHESCMTRIREAIISSYTESCVRINRPTRAVSKLTEDITDLQALFTVRDDIDVAFGRFDDTRQQAISATLKILRTQIQQARRKAAEIEIQISALEVVQERL